MADGATDMLHYEKSIPEMFVPNVLTFATEGKELQYAGICIQLINGDLGLRMSNASMELLSL